VRAGRTCIALLLVAGLLAGCGSSGNSQPRLTKVQAQSLAAELDAARVSAAGRDVAGTQAALAKFRRSVAQLRRAGALSDATARSLRVGAARVLQRVRSDNPPPAATQPAPAPTKPPPGPGKKHEKKHGKGKKHGEGDGEGGD
jgi:hypothetical protein